MDKLTPTYVYYDPRKIGISESELMRVLECFSEDYSQTALSLVRPGSPYEQEKVNELLLIASAAAAYFYFKKK